MSYLFTHESPERLLRKVRFNGQIETPRAQTVNLSANNTSQGARGSTQLSSVVMNTSSIIPTPSNAIGSHLAGVDVNSPNNGINNVNTNNINNINGFNHLNTNPQATSGNSYYPSTILVNNAGLAGTVTGVNNNGTKISPGINSQTINMQVWQQVQYQIIFLLVMK